MAIAHTRQETPTNDSTLAGDTSVSVDGGDGGDGGSGVGSCMEAVRGIQGVGYVLDETWDTAESPNFAAALQASMI